MSSQAPQTTAAVRCWCSSNADEEMGGFHSSGTVVEWPYLSGFCYTLESLNFFPWPSARVRIPFRSAFSFILMPSSPVASRCSALSHPLSKVRRSISRDCRHRTCHERVMSVVRVKLSCRSWNEEYIPWDECERYSSRKKKKKWFHDHVPKLCMLRNSSLG